jgi:predicted DNA-binding protein with PD1-like motif
LGYFDWPAKKYIENPIDDQVEVLSLIGNLTWSMKSQSCMRT